MINMIIKNELVDGYYFCLQKQKDIELWETIACTKDKRKLKRWFRKLRKGFRIEEVKKEGHEIKLIQVWIGYEDEI